MKFGVQAYSSPSTERMAGIRIMRELAERNLVPKPKLQKPLLPLPPILAANVTVRSYLDMVPFGAAVGLRARVSRLARKFSSAKSCPVGRQYIPGRGDQITFHPTAIHAALNELGYPHEQPDIKPKS